MKSASTASHRSSLVLSESRPDVRFLLLPLPDFTMLPFGGFLDKLRFSADDEDHSRQRYCEWKILGLTDSHIRSSSGVNISSDATVGQVDLTTFDYLVVFGSRTTEAAIGYAKEYGPTLRKAARCGLSLVCIDNASFLLAAAGLLKGYKVALHWRHIQEFRDAFPLIPVVSEQIYCFDRNRITCAGGATAIDMAVELLARHCGRQRALKGLADMLVDETRGHHHQLKSLDAEPNAGRHVTKAIALMRALMTEPLTIDDLAHRIGVGRRHLDRLFMVHCNLSAHDYWQKMRLEHLHWRVLNSNRPLSSLADEVGMSSTSRMSKLFCEHFGKTPAALRREVGLG